MPTREAYYEIADQWLERAVSELGITSADKYYAWLRESDLYAPRAIVRETWRLHWEAAGYAELISAYPEERIIPRSWIVERPSTSLEPYVAKFKFTAYNRLEKTFEETALYVPYSKQPSLTALKGRLVELLAKYKPWLEFDIDAVELEAIYHVEGERW